MKKSYCLVAIFGLLLVLPSLLITQEPVYWDAVSKIRKEGFERSQVVDYTWYLSEVIGPRLTASPNIRKAQQWAKTKMDEIGLVNTDIEPWGIHGVNWEIKYISLHMLEPDYQPVIGYPLAFTPGTNGKITGQPVIAVINTKKDLEKFRGKLHDKIILATPVMPVDPRFEPEAFRHTEKTLEIFSTEGIDYNIQKYQRGQLRQSPFRSEGVSAQELEKFYKTEGVAAVLQASIGSDGTVYATARPTGNRDRSLEGVRNSVPMLSVAAEHYNRIYRLAEHGIPVKMEVEVRVNMGTSDPYAFNVIGEIPGTDLADEIVMIGGHLDSWHTSTGATDNAGGCAVVLEAMRILRATGLKPRRTIRAALWSNEEGGLVGAREYVKKHFGNPRDGKKRDYDKLSVYFNMDNGTGQFRGVHMQGNELVAPIFEAWMKPFHDLRVKTLSKFSNRGTDHLAFDQAGLPGFQFIQDRIDYRARTHHFNMDLFDKVLPEDLKINAVVMAAFAYHAAMRDEKLPRKPFTNWNPQFGIMQENMFKDPRTLTNALADFDNDGDLDIFVGFNNKPNRLYRNDGGTFTDVASQVGLADSDVTRTSAWGDYNNDGHMDLFVGFVSRSGSHNKLYRNDGDGRHFTDVTESTGVSLTGSFRQACWVDYDNDGDVDLFVGLRDKPNVLFRNDGGTFTDVSRMMGVDDSRRTVGAVWFDFDKDSDLDLYVTNMDGDANGLFRNEGNRFIDIAPKLGIESGGRPLGLAEYGSVRPCLGDFDYDGNFDIFIANYGPNALYKNGGGGTFTNVAPELGLAIDNCYDTGTWGDYDNDGRLDLYVNGTITRGKSFRDYLFHNDGNRFTDVTPGILLRQNADHGAHWADIDCDGDLDLALTGAGADGMHYIAENLLKKERSSRSLQIMVLDAQGHYTRAGSEIRIFKKGTRELLGTGILDTGSGYNSQNAMPVHFGLPEKKPVDVEITTLTKEGRKTALLSHVNTIDYTGKILTVRVDNSGEILK